MQEKRLTAAEVRKLPDGAKVTIHGRDKYGYPTELPCKVVHSGNKKVLTYQTYYGPESKPIRQERGKYFTEGWSR